jgi:CBS domain-containing protein
VYLGAFRFFKPQNMLRCGINKPVVHLASPPGWAQPCARPGYPAGFAPSKSEKRAQNRSNGRSVIMQVRHILHGKGRDVVAIDSNASLREAARLLTARKIGALVVRAKSGVLAGILSERDVVHGIAAKGAAALDETVEQHMTPAPHTCTEGDSVEMVMEVMTLGRFRHVPVLDDGMQLCGMVSIGDVVKTRIAETVNEAAALRDYISATA